MHVLSNTKIKVLFSFHPAFRWGQTKVGTHLDVSRFRGSPSGYFSSTVTVHKGQCTLLIKHSHADRCMASKEVWRDWLRLVQTLEVYFEPVTISLPTLNVNVGYSHGIPTAIMIHQSCRWTWQCGECMTPWFTSTPHSPSYQGGGLKFFSRVSVGDTYWGLNSQPFGMGKDCLIPCS